MLLICTKAVPGSDLCSLPVTESEEGYGQKRLCLSCSVKANAPKLIESRAFENWGNQVQLHEKENLQRNRPCRNKIVESSPLTATGRNSGLHAPNSSNDDDNGDTVKNSPCIRTVSLLEGQAPQKAKPLPKDKPQLKAKAPLKTKVLPKAKPQLKAKTPPKTMVLAKDKPLPKDGEEQASDEHSQDEESRDEAIPASQSRGKYLQETYNPDQFLLTDKLASVPILKSESTMQLKPVRKDGTKIDLANTGPFDSVFQLTLTISFASKLFFDNAIKANAGVDPFMKMIHDVHHHKITTGIYRQRADILRELFPPKGHRELDCLVA